MKNISFSYRYERVTRQASKFPLVYKCQCTNLGGLEKEGKRLAALGCHGDGHARGLRGAHGGESGHRAEETSENGKEPEQSQTKTGRIFVKYKNIDLIRVHSIF